MKVVVAEQERARASYEVLCKVLCHNICVVIQSMYELGVEPMFWRNARDQTSQEETLDISSRQRGASPEEYEQMMDPSYGVTRVFPVRAFHRQIHSLWGQLFSFRFATNLYQIPRHEVGVRPLICERLDALRFC